MAVTVASFKTSFSRGQLDYGTELPEIRDVDIEKAIAEATAIFNPGIYPTDNPDLADMAFSYLAAHFLQCDVDAADGQGQARFNQTSRSVDGVSESVDIPEWMKADEFAFYATTYYGQKWLILTKPYLDGAVFVVEGGTTP